MGYVPRLPRSAGGGPGLNAAEATGSDPARASEPIPGELPTRPCPKDTPNKVDDATPNNLKSDTYLPPPARLWFPQPACLIPSQLPVIVSSSGPKGSERFWDFFTST